jgi:hypothetical protein
MADLTADAGSSGVPRGRSRSSRAGLRWAEARPGQIGQARLGSWPGLPARRPKRTCPAESPTSIRLRPVAHHAQAGRVPGGIGDARNSPRGRVGSVIRRRSDPPHPLHRWPSNSRSIVLAATPSASPPRRGRRRPTPKRKASRSTLAPSNHLSRGLRRMCSIQALRAKCCITPWNWRS